MILTNLLKSNKLLYIFQAYLNLFYIKTISTSADPNIIVLEIKFCGEHKPKVQDILSFVERLGILLRFSIEPITNYRSVVTLKLLVKTSYTKREIKKIKKIIKYQQY